jgi:glucokinase
MEPTTLESPPRPNRDTDSERNMVVGVDLGGTHTRVGIVDRRDQKLHHFAKHPTAKLTLDGLCDLIATTIAPFEGNVSGVGMGVTGICDRQMKIVHTTGGFVPFLEGCNVVEAIEARLGIPAWVDNDARAHAVGEYKHGGWEKLRSMVVMTLGTGVGLAWILDGKLYPPPDYGAEGGHMAGSLSDGPLCSCGIAGCLESWASGTGIAAEARRRLTNVNVSTSLNEIRVENLCESMDHDPIARECIEFAIQELGRALHTIRHLYFPDLIVLGGGAAVGLWPHLSDLRQTLFSARRFDGGQTRLELSKLGDKAGVLGAVNLGKYHVGRDGPR